MLLFDDFVRGVDDHLRAGKSGTRLMFVLSVTRQIRLVMKCLGADFALKLSVGPGMDPDAVTL